MGRFDQPDPGQDPAYCDGLAPEPELQDEQSDYRETPQYVRDLEASLLADLIAFALVTAKRNSQGECPKLHTDLAHEWADVAHALLEDQASPQSSDIAWARAEARRLLDLFVDPLGVIRDEEERKRQHPIEPLPQRSPYSIQDFFRFAAENARREFKR